MLLKLSMHAFIKEKPIHLINSYALDLSALIEIIQ